MSSLIEDNDSFIADSLSISTQKLSHRGKSRTHNLENYCRDPKEDEPSHDLKNGKPISYYNSCKYFTSVVTNF